MSAAIGVLSSGLRDLGARRMMVPFDAASGAMSSGITHWCVPVQSLAHAALEVEAEREGLHHIMPRRPRPPVIDPQSVFRRPSAGTSVSVVC